MSVKPFTVSAHNTCAFHYRSLTYSERSLVGTNLDLEKPLKSVMHRCGQCVSSNLCQSSGQTTGRGLDLPTYERLSRTLYRLPLSVARVISKVPKVELVRLERAIYITLLTHSYVGNIAHTYVEYLYNYKSHTFTTRHLA